MRIPSEILEHGQDDFCIVLEDYRIAKLSWQHFSVAYGELGSEPNDVRTAVDAARIGLPFDYILTGLVFDLVLAISRLTDDGRERGASERVNLLTVQSHLVAKRLAISDAELRSNVDLALTNIKGFRTHPVVQRIRDRRNSYLAHRLRPKLSELNYGELEDALQALSQLFETLAPLFHASKGYPDGVSDDLLHSTQRFWRSLGLGAQNLALESSRQSNLD